MRYVILGAGAVGGTIGGLLFEHGHDVVLLARGDHLERLRRDGLRLHRPGSEVLLRVPVAGSPDEAGLTAGDVVLLATKTQDTLAALEALAAAAPPDLPVFCAQNGVENERLALRRFERVYAVTVMLPATFLEPGVVHAHGTPKAGILDLGRYPQGVDALAERVAGDLDAAGFSSRAEPAIMRSKYRKLLMNLRGSLEALTGRDERDLDLPLYRRAREEAQAVFAAAGIEACSGEEDRARRSGVMRAEATPGSARVGRSSWQSLARGTGTIETDYLNGEIVLLGRLHGVPTPVNALIQQLACRLAREGGAPGSFTVQELEARLGQALTTGATPR